LNTWLTFAISEAPPESTVTPSRHMVTNEDRFDLIGLRAAPANPCEPVGSERSGAKCDSPVAAKRLRGGSA
jgi:hypothetical protein